MNSERHQIFTQISLILLQLFSLSFSNAQERYWISGFHIWTSPAVFSKATLDKWFLRRQHQTRIKVKYRVKYCIGKSREIFLCGVPDTPRQPWNVLKFQWVQRQQTQARKREVPVRYQGKHPQWGQWNPAARAQRGWWISACGGVKHQTGQGLSSLD